MWTCICWVDFLKKIGQFFSKSEIQISKLKNQVILEFSNCQKWEKQLVEMARFQYWIFTVITLWFHFSKECKGFKTIKQPNFSYYLANFKYITYNYICPATIKKNNPSFLLIPNVDSILWNGSKGFKSIQKTKICISGKYKMVTCTYMPNHNTKSDPIFLIISNVDSISP